MAQESLYLFLWTALFSLLMQIGTNLANDAFDFLKGADTPARTGPPRAVQQGWITPQAMLRTASVTFAIAFMIAIPLMIIAGPWSLPITLLAIACGILYTGGPKPFGYLGLGELLVLIFFGPIATCGTYLLQTGTITKAALIASLAPGLFSCALLIANNLRDETTDRIAYKKTLVVRFGSLFGKLEYTFALAIGTLIPLILVLFYNAPANLLGAFFLFPITFQLAKKAFANDPSLLPGTSLLFFFYTLLFILSYR
jgi:1,4-dihydroxy-2-naphthoate octaprenyltransferase